VVVVDGAIHSQKDGKEGNGCSLKDGAEAVFAAPARRSAGSAVYCPST